MTLQERWEKNQAKKDHAAAVAQFQGEMPVVKKCREGSGGKYHYASYDDIMRVAAPILARNGLSIAFDQSETDTALTLTCHVRHTGGHTEDTTFTLPKDAPIQTREGRNVTTLAQAQGSANTYAKRYALCNALNIVVSDEDDDGELAGQNVETITQDQADDIRERCQALKSKPADICKWFGVKELEHVPASKLPEIEAVFAKKEAVNKAGGVQ